MNIGKMIVTIILIIVYLSVAVAMYPVLTEFVDNVTGSGWTGSAIVAIISTLYWIIVGATSLLGFILGMGLDKMMKQLNRLG